MIERKLDAPPEKATALAHWQRLLQDDVALLAAPGAHHKALLRQAHALHQERLSIAIISAISSSRQMGH